MDRSNKFVTILLIAYIFCNSYYIMGNIPIVNVNSQSSYIAHIISLIIFYSILIIFSLKIPSIVENKFILISIIGMIIFCGAFVLSEYNFSNNLNNQVIYDINTYAAPIITYVSNILLLGLSLYLASSAGKIDSIFNGILIFLSVAICLLELAILVMYYYYGINTSIPAIATST